MQTFFYIFILFLFFITLFLLFKFKNQIDFFKLIIDSLNKIVIVADKNGNIIFKNSSFDKKIASKIDNLNKLKILHKNSIKEPFFKYLREKKEKSIKTVIFFDEKRLAANIKKIDFKENYIFIIKDISKEEDYINQINKIYYHDTLTNLPNKMSFYENLQILITKSSWSEIKFSLIMVEISNLSNIVNFLGIDAGNEAIKSIAKTLKEKLNNKNTQIYRFEGSKFVIIIKDLYSSAKLKEIVKPILDSAAAPFKIKSYEVKIDLKIGAVFYPYFNVDKDTLIKYINFTLNEAKLNHKSLVIFSEPLKKMLENRDFILNNLPYAIKNKELEIFFQPKLNLNSFKIDNAEVLIRWNHPEYGYIPPSSFIPIAEQTNTILEIGEFVIEETCKYLHNRKKFGLNTINLAVNISQKQLTYQNIAKILKEKLKKYNLTPNLIELEITESSIMGNENQTLKILENLKDLGFTISLDDFGTGYSSLNLLSKLPIDKLKIDKSFIDNHGNGKNLTILSHIVSLAKKLNLKIVVEGIETKEQLILVKKLGCDEVQGYFISKPLNKQNFGYFVKNYKFL